MCIPKKVGGMGAAGTGGKETSEDGAPGDARLDEAAFVLQLVHAENMSTSKQASRRPEEVFIMTSLLSYRAKIGSRWLESVNFRRRHKKRSDHFDRRAW
jgi:hypothetical protein